MSWRRLPPVHSPLSAAAIGAGLGAALIPARARLARTEVEQWLQATYAPASWRWTDSGTSALALALRLASEEGRRPVALPAYGCYDLATACDAAQVRVFLYDVDPATLGPDWDSLERALEAGAGVVVAVHLYGVPVNLDRLMSLAARHGALVVEDAAQGVGGSWRGRPLGGHGVLSVLSFGRGKGNTSGGGGALLAHDARLADRLPRLPPGGAGLTAVAKTFAQYLLSRPALYSIPASLPFLGLGETVYHPPRAATAMTLGGFGVLSRSALELEVAARHRERLAAHYLERLHGSGWQPVGVPPGGVAGWLRFPILRPPSSAMRAWMTGFGIMPGYPRPLSDLPGFGTKVARGTSVAGARLLSERLLTLPTHGQVNLGDAGHIVRKLRKENAVEGSERDHGH